MDTSSSLLHCWHRVTKLAIMPAVQVEQYKILNNMKKKKLFCWFCQVLLKNMFWAKHLFWVLYWQKIRLHFYSLTQNVNPQTALVLRTAFDLCLVQCIYGRYFSVCILYQNGVTFSWTLDLYLRHFWTDHIKTEMFPSSEFVSRVKICH